MHYVNFVALTNNWEASECTDHEVGAVIIDARLHMVDSTVEISRTRAIAKFTEEIKKSENP